ncbi:hypothetical protein YC2023_075954 [Brassica napus]
MADIMKQILAKPIQLSESGCEPILCLIWEHIALLHTGPLEDSSNAAASLVSIARDSDHYTELIIAEGGIRPLLVAGEQVSLGLTDFFTRAKQVKRIEISDQHSLATQKKDMYGL